jgi:hypothetical protein
LPAAQLDGAVQAGYETALSIVESRIVNAAEPLSWITPPLIREFSMSSPDAELPTTSGLQSTVLESITVSDAVIVHGPVYVLSRVPGGTPVFDGPGKHPPHGSGPSGVSGVELAQCAVEFGGVGRAGGLGATLAAARAA